MSKQQLVAINTSLGHMLEEKKDALPQGFNTVRFQQNCMTVLTEVKGLEKMDKNTVVRTMLKGAFLGLDFFNRECYAIPYGQSLQFQTDYKGEIKLAKKYSTIPIKEIYAKVVREGDEFEEFVENGHQFVNFRPKPFNNGELIGVFAVVFYEDGSMQYETMSKEQVEYTRDKFSKMKNGQSWKDSFPEMAKKTVLRRLCKLIDLDFDNQDQFKAFEDGSLMDVKQDTKKEPVKATSSLDPEPEPIEAEVIELDDDVEEVFNADFKE